MDQFKSPTRQTIKGIAKRKEKRQKKKGGRGKLARNRSLAQHRSPMGQPASCSMRWSADGLLAHVVPMGRQPHGQAPRLEKLCLDQYDRSNPGGGRSVSSLRARLIPPFCITILYHNLLLFIDIFHM
jgi:hypothetical protein